MLYMSKRVFKFVESVLYSPINMFILSLQKFRCLIT